MSRLSTIRAWTRRLAARARVPLGLVLVLTSLGCAASGPQRVAFGEIVAGNPAEYDDYLIKLTYMGSQTSVLVSLVFGSAPDLEMAPFAPYRRPGYDYTNDDLGDFAAFRTSAGEIEAILDALENDPVFTDDSDRPEPIASMTIVRGASGPASRGFETLIPEAEAGRLLDAILIPSLDPANDHGRDLLTFWSKNVS